MAQPTEAFGIGRPVLRKEDARLLTGRGSFSDDMNLPGQAYAYVARAPHAHARILRIECAAARRAPGVICILTAADYVGEGLGPLPRNPVGSDVAPTHRDGSPRFFPPNHPLALDKVRRAGEGVALVVAESAALAKDAAELIEVDYEVLPAVVDPAAALAPGAPAVWDEVPGNLCIEEERGDSEATDAAFRRAAHIVRLETVNQRVNGVPLEPRAALGTVDPRSGVHTLHAGNQGILVHKRGLSAVFGVPEDKVRVVARDTGGGFGTRGLLLREFVLVVWAARRTARPVKWTCERSEAFLADPCGRDLATRAELALAADGTFLALRVVNTANLGSHSLHFAPLLLSAAVPTGVYAVPAAHVRLQAVFTNTVPTTVLRGAGRPEAMFVMERLIDLAAAQMRLERDELRRRNLIAPSMLPFVNPVGTRIDSGRFRDNMEKALELADWHGFEARRAQAARRGRLRGIGLANHIDTATGSPHEQADLAVSADGRVQAVLGTQASGQGHETCFAQMVVEFLGVPFESVDVHEGDSNRVKIGGGSHSSRSMRLGGLLLGQAAEAIVGKGRVLAAAMLEASPDDIEYRGGRFAVAGTDRSVGLFEAAAAHPDRGLCASARNAQPMFTFANGCQVCELEIDPETGRAAIVRWVTVDDAGRIVNPLLLDGQTHGGIAQAVGQALLEACVYERESGQLLSGSFMDYAMPRADQFPEFVLAKHEDRAPNNPLGIKGAKGGILSAQPAVINAIVDALKDHGVRHVEMPATPERLWRVLHGDRRKRNGSPA